MDDSLPLWGKGADIESEKERMEKGEDMEAGEVTMQMQEYIYLATTPMYFLGASGRIVGRIESPHLAPPRRGPLSSFSRGLTNPSSPSPFFHARCVCTMRVPPAGPILGRFTSKLAPVPRANRPASYGPIQFNFENKQPPTATLVNLFGNTATDLVRSEIFHLSGSRVF